MNLKSRAQKLKSDIPAIFLALNDQGTPMTGHGGFHRCSVPATAMQKDILYFSLRRNVHIGF